MAGLNPNERKSRIAGAVLRIARTAPVAAAAFALLSAATTFEARAETKLVVAKVADDFALIMGDFGKSQGIFQKHGLAIEFPRITPAKMVQAMLAGSVDMAMAGGNTILFAAKGAPIKAVAALDGPPKMLVLSVAPNSKIKSPDDLKGKTVAISNKGSLTDWAVSQLALAKGWPDSSITRASIGDTPGRVAAVRSGAADAAVIDIAAAAELEVRGEGKTLMNFGDVIKNYQNQMVFATDKIIKEKPEAVKAYLAGLFETLAFARSHRKETVAFAAQELKVNEDVAGKVYDALLGSPGFFSTDGRFDPKTLAAMTHEFEQSKRIPPGVELKSSVNESFLPAAK
jgi:NitT/TauT family transport system substrate-binding protein